MGVRIYWGPFIVPLNGKVETVLWCLGGLILEQSSVFGEAWKISKCSSISCGGVPYVMEFILVLSIMHGN